MTLLNIDAGVTSVNDLCSDLIESPFFKTEQDYIRHQLIHSLIQVLLPIIQAERVKSNIG